MPGRTAHRQKQGPVQRPGRAADGRHQGHPHRLEQSADVAGLTPGALVELAQHRPHAAIHVDAVVRVADGRVQLCQLLAPLRDGGREGA